MARLSNTLQLWKKKGAVTQQDAPILSSKPFTVAKLKNRYYDLRSEVSKVELELEKEFSAIGKIKSEKQTFYHGSRIENDHKNRYKNIIPFDHCRVKLPGGNQRLYFNGVLVTGRIPPKDFLVPRLPLFETVNDFWSMIWQQKCGTIVNLVRHVEGGKDRGMVYWPEEGEKRYGKITVTKISKRNMDFFNFYTFDVVNGTGDQEDSRDIIMFHFLGWPITGVPETSTDLTTFIYNIRHIESLRPHQGPMVCHCSAGTGRSGIFIGIWNSLDQLMVSDILDLYKETIRMRKEFGGKALPDDLKAQLAKLMAGMEEALKSAELIGAISQENETNKAAIAEINGQMEDLLDRYKILQDQLENAGTGTADQEDSRDIIMFHFLGWPITGVPVTSTDLTTFIYNIRHIESLRPHQGPMVCHCSAGTGRSGIFIGIWKSLDQLMVSDILDLYKETIRMRSDRTKLIFTLVQYKFLHRAILDIVSSVDYQQLKQAGFCLELVPVANMNTQNTSPTTWSDASTVGSITENAVVKTTEKEDLSLAKKKVPASAEIKRPVAEHLFERYMELLTDNEDEMLKENFSFIEKFDHVINNSCYYGFKEENSPKNRYRNILPVDHSRVKLTLKGPNINSDYINANYIHGYNKPRAFIATQAPLPETIEDFWAMIWDQNELKRKVVLFNYISWPENSVPETPSNFLKFLYNIRYVDSLRPNKQQGPMVCHCSAGTGRTGIFIGIWSGLDRLTSKNDLDLLCLVGQMRQQRRKIVFNSVRYKFLHDAMLMVVTQTNLTEMKSTGFALQMGRGVDEMKFSNIISNSAAALNLNGFRKGGDIKFTTLFQLSFSCTSHFTIAVDHSRVKLTLKGPNINSDYINANYIHGYNKPRAFIVTQVPIPETIEDFWAMIWDQNELKRKVVLFNYTSWPENSVPETPSNFLKFLYNIRYVDSIRPNKQQGPMVCHCSAGTGRTGIFIGIWNSLDRLTNKNDLDLLCLVGQMRQQRRKIVFNSVQYKFLHDAMLMVVTQTNLTEMKSTGFALPMGRGVDEMKFGNIISNSAATLNLNGFRKGNFSQFAVS
eukprot:sb/3479423/